jgi:hypothetical protein
MESYPNLDISPQSPQPVENKQVENKQVENKQVENVVVPPVVEPPKPVDITSRIEEKRPNQTLQPIYHESENEDDRKKTYLKINSAKIERLSGVTNFAYLFPSSPTLKLPVIVLMGVAETNELCGRCDQSKTIGNCVAIDNPLLYYHLAKAYAAPNNPLDVYIKKWGNRSFTDFVNDTVASFGQWWTAAKSFEMFDDVSKIPDRAAEIRQTSSFGESVLRNLSTLKPILSDEMRLQHTDVKYQPDTFENMFVQSSQTVNPYLLSLLNIAKTGDLQKTVQKIFEGMDSTELPPSVLKKEIGKIKMIQPGKITKFFREMYEISLKMSPNQPDWAYISDSISSTSSSGGGSGGGESIRKACEWLIGPVADLYFIARVMKEPCLSSKTLKQVEGCKAERPPVVINLTGRESVKLLVTLLEASGLYRKRCITGAGNRENCVRIDVMIDMDSDVRKIYDSYGKFPKYKFRRTPKNSVQKSVKMSKKSRKKSVKKTRQNKKKSGKKVKKSIRQSVRKVKRSGRKQ